MGPKFCILMLQIFIHKLFYDAVSATGTMYSQTCSVEDRELWVGKNLERDGHGLFEGPIG